jgi:SAM-dependent methyltransferase
VINWLKSARTKEETTDKESGAQPSPEVAAVQAQATAETVAAPIWEDMICLNSDREPSFETLGPAAEHYAADSRKDEWSDLDYRDALQHDHSPLPITADREGYYGPDHFSYWASGLKDANMLIDACHTHGVSLKNYLDFGCASGRVIRHFAAQHPDVGVIGCDINRHHVEWCNRFLAPNCVTFQNHSIPSLPLEDNSLDLVSAFSVFTHIEALETAWLMELRRVLRPGGIAWITVHSELTLEDMDETWPLWSPVMTHPLSSRLDERRNFPGERFVMRWLSARSYSANVFYKLDYVKTRWSRIMEIAEIRRRCPSYQDVVILRKPLAARESAS